VLRTGCVCMKVFEYIVKLRKISKNSYFFKRFENLQKILSFTNKLIIYKSEISKTVRDMGEKETTEVSSNLHSLHQDRRTIETRIKIYDLVSKNPGLHLSKIADMLDMSEQLAEYHLFYMIRNNLVIESKAEGGHYKRFYLKDDDIGIDEKRKLAVLRQKSLLKIILLLLEHHNLKHKEIVSFLDIAPSTLSYQLTKLIESGIVDVVPYGEGRGYILNDEHKTMWLIGKYNLDSTLKNNTISLD